MSISGHGRRRSDPTNSQNDVPLLSGRLSPASYRRTVSGAFRHVETPTKWAERLVLSFMLREFGFVHLWISLLSRFKKMDDS